MEGSGRLGSGICGASMEVRVAGKNAEHIYMYIVFSSRLMI